MDLNNMTVSQLQQLFGGSPSKTPTGPCECSRAVVVCDRGWIFAGDWSQTPDGYVRLSNAVHVFSWSEIGFARMLNEWKTNKVDIRKLEQVVEIPSDAVLFRIPVAAEWGKK